MQYDIAIIGAGPAGSAAALKLSSLGHRTLMIDPCDNKKVCAGILTAQYVRKYGIDEGIVEKKLKGIRISFRDINAEIIYRKGSEYSINRGSYDQINLDEAIAAGSELKKDKAVFIRERESTVILKTEKGRFVADYAIIASGVSDFSRICGGTKNYAYCVQQKRYVTHDDYFEMDLKNGGYSWIAPKKDHILSGTFSLSDYPDIRGERGLIPVGGPVKRTFSRRSLLAGDAAGFVSPLEGDGLYYARRSGEMAAEIISTALSDKKTLDDYEKNWKKEFDFSILTVISHLLSNETAMEAFVTGIRDDERFNKLVEDILTKESKKFKIKDIPSLIKELVK